MWLDRFSGQSTPAGGTTPNRYPSPAPRRTSHLAPAPRPGLGLNPNRSNLSLSLSNNTSSVSLGSPTKSSSGPTLRFEQKPPPNVQNPTEVLRAILNLDDASLDSGKPTDNAVVDIDEEKENIDFGDLSLQEFVDQQPRLKPRAQEAPDLVKEHREKFESFHKSIAESDQVLNNVETYLTNFKAELGQVSAEIENLQERSVQLNARLENRRQVEKLLGPTVEDVSVSPNTVRSIADGPIDDAFVRALAEIEARSAILAKKDSAGPVKALEDVKPMLEDLKAKAVERIRDYVVGQIKLIRAPNTSAQLVQHQSFIRNKEIFPFLARSHPVLSDEIGQAYVNTMKWYYSSNFARYQQALQKLPLHAVDQADLIGAEPSAPRRSVLGAGKATQQQHDAFSIGKRAEVLKSKNDSVIPSYLAEDSKNAQYLEVPFRNFNQALIDNVTSEYAVASEMFSMASYKQVTKKVEEVFQPTFALGHSLTKTLLEHTTDCLGILMCVRLNQHFAFELQRRKVPGAESYINYTNILLWPRFQQVMDQHCESLKKVPTAGGRGAAAAFSLVGGGDASKTSVAPHAVTQRFGQFLHGILSLSKDAGDDEPLSNSLGRLRTEYQSLVTKLSKGAGDTSKRPRFLFNNYSLVLTIISDAQGKLAEEQKEFFGNLLADSKAR